MENSKISELFATPANAPTADWPTIASQQNCPFLGRKCLKNRKSQADISIGTCAVKYGKENRDVVICPHRMLENKQIFMDCIHLLTLHEPGNELHILPEISLPGGSVDYFLASVREKKVRDFVGIEIQTLDTTGTVWPERQRFLKSKGIEIEDWGAEKPFGMNWKMTAKTTLVQLHHKVQTFENLGKHLVLVLQDCLLEYVQQEFNFSHVSQNPKLGDPMHFHAYQYQLGASTKGFKLSLKERRSTNGEGIARCLGLQAEANVELGKIAAILEAKISAKTLLKIQ